MNLGFKQRHFLTVWLVLFCTDALCLAQGSLPREDAPAPLSPAEAQRQFKVADGLKITLVVSEPRVAQPLSISFDDRGRMWVLQYRQFPNPNGLKPVRVDNWLRTQYDRLPEPPPRGPKGNDRISIYDDADGDGRADRVTHFISNLNLASGMALGYGGVFVLQSPYLLFYPDRNRDDVPDGDPEVLLKGFGMEDAHAFANSLTWGPDGWLYGAQGSTASAEIRGIGFQQGVWRYHPRTREFELFAEGGGNTWGIDFDRFGNLFAGGNTVEPLVHHVQGAYYVKGFGKHGPLHNPHAYGYFQPVQHHGYVGDSLTGGFVLYQGGAFPERFNGACIAPNTRHSASRWSTLEMRGSTFATRAAGDFITSSDIWFRPVDSTVGPDGALYVADWYDYNISHSSPKNRSEWYQPSRGDGRIWRVAPQSVRPISSGSFDLAARSSDDLIDLLSHPNAWYARQAHRLCAERRDDSVLSVLMEMIGHKDQQLALRALWTIYVSGGFDDQLAGTALSSQHEYVRAWTVRLLGDARDISPRICRRLTALATAETSVIVRSQLACTAKRLPADVAISLITPLLERDEDVKDEHISMLIWWALESKAISDLDQVLSMFESRALWKRPLTRQYIVERLARRLASEVSADGFAGCSRLITLAPAPADLDRVLNGMTLALSGLHLGANSVHLRAALAVLSDRRKQDARVVELGLRAGTDPAVAVRIIEDTARPDQQRIAIIRALGETRSVGSVTALLRLISGDASPPLRDAAFAAMGYFDDKRIPAELITAYQGLASNSRVRAIDLLCARRDGATALLTAIHEKQIDSTDVSPDQVRKILEHENQQLQQSAIQIWGRIRIATPLEMQGRIKAVTQLLARDEGMAANGARLFEKHCANCHLLHGKGTALGPDLTGAERRDRRKLVGNIVDPSAEVRPQFVSHIALTGDGRIVTGLLAASSDSTITLLDAKNKRIVLNRSEVEELRESPVSLMPEKLLDELTDQQIRDLVSFIQSEQSESALPRQPRRSEPK